MPTAHASTTQQFRKLMESVTPHRLSFDAMSLEEAAAAGCVQDEPKVEHANSDVRVLGANQSCNNSQTIHPCSTTTTTTSIQTPPVLKRKRRPSTVKAPREPTRDVLWIQEPPLLPSDLDWNDDHSNDDQNSTLSSLQSASLASSYNPFLNINNRRTRDVQVDSQNVEPTMPPNGRTPLSFLGFPNIPSLDTPEAPKALLNPQQSTMPSVPNVSIWGSKGPLKMRRLNSLGGR